MLARLSSLWSGAGSHARRSALATVLFAGALGFLPLAGGPGYEAALVNGLALGPIVALGVALEVSARAQPPREAFGLGAKRGLGLGALAYAVSLAHGARVGFCSPLEGSLYFALGPWAGALLAGLWGAGAGHLAARSAPRRRRFAAVALALSGPLGSVAVNLAFGYLTPTVFAFDPFVGFFSGTLYDTVIDGVGRMATYRLGSLFSALAVAGLALELEAGSGGAWVRARARPGLAGLFGAAAALASAGMVAAGSRFGHWHTAETIARELGGARAGARCLVLYPSAQRDEQADLFARECEREAERVATYLGAPSPPRITVYVFADAEQKRRLMGASHTQVAKPWRREVYVNAAAYPHPVLGHELAHALAGTFARGPFRVAGTLGGLLPDPGLIEGLAVDAAPDDDDLSPRGWASAMLALGLLPPLEKTFSLGFFAKNSSLSYTAAGAFVGWVREGHGAAAVRRWYGGERLEAVTGKPLAELEREFRAALGRDQPSEPSLAVARARFDRPAIFARRCPHERDGLRAEATSLLGAGDVRAAARRYDRLLGDDGRDGAALLGRATCSERLGDLPDARARLEAAAADPSLPKTTRDRAEERLGDLALAAGDVARAEARYAALAERTQNEDALRTLDVKREAAREPSPLARPAVVALLVGAPATGPDPQAAAELLGRWDEQSPGPAGGLPSYLLGRGAFNRGDHRRAAALLDRSLELGVASPRVAREAARLRALSACALADAEGARRALEAWEATRPPPTQRHQNLREFARRCAGP
ncbi:MAG TPA: hypothetical protein VFS43_48195 [Polyangiaceae bacterium]|nr:hypothetical protein [Polyangiaceae bacterium]